MPITKLAEEYWETDLGKEIIEFVQVEFGTGGMAVEEADAAVDLIMDRFGLDETTANKYVDGLS